MKREPPADRSWAEVSAGNGAGVMSERLAVCAATRPAPCAEVRRVPAGLGGGGR